MTASTRFRALLLAALVFLVFTFLHSERGVRQKVSRDVGGLPLLAKPPSFLDVDIARLNGGSHSQQAAIAEEPLNGPPLYSNLPGKPSSPPTSKPTPSPKSTSNPIPSNITRALIMGSIHSDNTSWTTNLPFTTHIYDVETPGGPDNVPMNKGNEVMAYLTYIINHYTTLPTISIFAHANRFQWHNPDLLDQDSLQLLSRLSTAKVLRDGYVNLRCDPNECPDHIRTGNTEVDEDWKEEEVHMAAAWRDMFPHEPLPAILSQACCSQFAVTRERILSRPLSTYLRMRDWLMRTELADDISGRIFEYVWQYVFADVFVFCPEAWVCYCEVFGVCFEGEMGYKRWMRLLWDKEELDEEWDKLAAERSEAERGEEERREAQRSSAERSEARPGGASNGAERSSSKVGRSEGAAPAEAKKIKDEAANTSKRKAEIRKEIDVLRAELDRRRDGAVARGDELRRAKGE